MRRPYCVPTAALFPQGAESSSRHPRRRPRAVCSLTWVRCWPRSCVAGIALDRRAVGLRRALAAGTGWLRRLHSGLVGDQVTWLVAGLALLAALSEAALR